MISALGHRTVPSWLLVNHFTFSGRWYREGILQLQRDRQGRMWYVWNVPVYSALLGPASVDPYHISCVLYEFHSVHIQCLDNFIFTHIWWNISECLLYSQIWFSRISTHNPRVVQAAMVGTIAVVFTLVYWSRSWPLIQCQPVYCLVTNLILFQIFEKRDSVQLMVDAFPNRLMLGPMLGPLKRQKRRGKGQEAPKNRKKKATSCWVMGRPLKGFSESCLIEQLLHWEIKVDGWTDEKWTNALGILYHLSWSMSDFSCSWNG
jgi:hypothetical protein